MIKKSIGRFRLLNLDVNSFIESNEARSRLCNSHSSFLNFFSWGSRSSKFWFRSGVTTIITLQFFLKSLLAHSRLIWFDPIITHSKPSKSLFISYVMRLPFILRLILTYTWERSNLIKPNRCQRVRSLNFSLSNNTFVLFIFKKISFFTFKFDL